MFGSKSNQTKNTPNFFREVFEIGNYTQKNQISLSDVSRMHFGSDLNCSDSVENLSGLNSTNIEIQKGVFFRPKHLLFLEKTSDPKFELKSPKLTGKAKTFEQNISSWSENQKCIIRSV